MQMDYSLSGRVSYRLEVSSLEVSKGIEFETFQSLLHYAGGLESNMVRPL